LLPRLTAAKSEMAREVWLPPHEVQAVGASDWLMGRSLEKVLSQSAHTYS
jgi:hypothetical protein